MSLHYLIVSAPIEMPIISYEHAFRFWVYQVCLSTCRADHSRKGFGRLVVDPASQL
jgi:hypothetical protein